MPKTQKIIQSMNAGELSPLMDQRIDQAKYVSGNRTMENFLPLIYGGIERRPGTRYVGTTKSNGTARLKVFEYNIDTVYLLEFGNQYIRVYEIGAGSAYDTQYYIRTAHKGDVGNWTTPTAYIIGDFVSIAGTPATYFRCIVNHTSGATHLTPPGNTTDWIAADNATDTDYAIYELVSPYLTADLFKLKFEHSNDVMWITHPDYEPRRLSRIAHTNANQVVAFTLIEEALDDGPFIDQNTDEGVTITPSGSTGTITLTASSAIFTTGTTAGHAPSGTAPTSKSLTGALFKLVHAIEDSNVNKSFTAADQSSDLVLVCKGVHWDFITTGVWQGQIVVERSYDIAGAAILLDKLTADGTFAASTGWTSTGWTIGSGKATHNTGNTTSLEGTTTVESGKTYQINLQVLEGYHGKFYVYLGTNRCQGLKGVYYGVASGDNVNFKITPRHTNFNRAFDSISIYEVTTSDIIWETVFTVSSEKNANSKTDMVEEEGDAYYRMSSSLGPFAAWSKTANCQFSIRDSSHIGIVEITAVSSTTVATATVVKSLGDITDTHRWSEGYFSNKNGWPRCVAISPEERLTYAGSKSYPLTVWGSKIGEYKTFEEGTADDEPIIFTLIGQGQQNVIRWMKSKDVTLIGTSDGEHIIGASTKDKPLTPTNVRAKIQSSFGSADVDSVIVGDAILFVQRGARKLRELRYSWESDSYDADNLTRFAEHITTSGIKEMAYQRVPEPIVWCVRDDGTIAVLCYDKKENVFAWSRIVTAQTSSSDGVLDNDGYYKSVTVSSTSGEEDRVYVIVTRSLTSGTKNYIEYFSMRDYTQNEELKGSKGSVTTIDNTDLNAFFVDCGIIFSNSGVATVTITGLDHLDGETVAVWGSNEVTLIG